MRQKNSDLSQVQIHTGRDPGETSRAKVKGDEEWEASGGAQAALTLETRAQE